MRRLLPDGLLLGLDIVVVLAWLTWLGRTGGSVAPPLTAALFAGAGGYALVRLLLPRMPAAWVRVAIVVGGIAAVLAGARWWLYGAATVDPTGRSITMRLLRDLVAGEAFVSAAALLSLAILVPWWRGARLGGSYPYASRARAAATRAYFALALLALLLGLADREIAFDPGYWIGAATMLALGALSSAHLGSIARGETGAGVPTKVSGMLGTWTGTFALAASAVLSLAVLLGALATGAAPALLAPLRAVGALLRLILVAILARLTLLIFYVVEAVYALLTAFTEPDEAALAGEQAAEDLAERIGAVDPIVWPPWLDLAVRWLLAGLLLLLVLAWLWSGLRARREHAPGEKQPQERESALSAARIGRDLAAGIALLRAAAADALASGLDWRTRGVRRLYARLLRRLAGSGAAREPGDTPYEYRPRAAQALPGHDGDLDALTEAYVRARYGEQEPDAPTWAALREAWRRLSGARAQGIVDEAE